MPDPALSTAVTDVQVCGAFLAISTAYKQFGDPTNGIPEWAPASRPWLPGKVHTCHKVSLGAGHPASCQQAPVLHANGLHVGGGCMDPMVV